MKIRLTLILLLFFSGIKISKSQPAVTSFFIEPQYLSGSNVMINSDPTNIVFDFEIFRGQWMAVGEDISVNAVLIYKDALGNETPISPAIPVNSFSFGSTDSWFYSERVHASIPAAYTSGTIQLKVSGYNYNSAISAWLPFTWYTSTTYGQVLGGTPIPPPVLYPTMDVFPSWYSGNTYNITYTDPASYTVPFTKISPNDGQAVLTVGQSIYSPNSNYRLTLQTDGNLVLYRKNSNNTETGIWSSRTVGRASASLYFQTDGNLVLYSGSSTPLSPSPAIWTSSIYNSAGLGNVSASYYALQDDGNLVFYWPSYHTTYSKYPIWVIAASSDTPGGAASAHGGNLVHTLNSSASDTGNKFQNSR